MVTTIDYTKYDNVFVMGSETLQISRVIKQLAVKINQSHLLPLKDSTTKGLKGLPRKKNTKYTNNLVILNGVVNLSDFDFLRKELEAFKTFFEETQTIFVVIRSQCDNPALFREINAVTPYFVLLPDYSLIKTKTLNILCVGGGISVNRYWKKTQSNPMYEYFGNEEMPLPLDSDFDKMIAKEKLDIVVTNTPPSFLNESLNSQMGVWQNYDKTLKNDLIQCYTIIDALYNLLLQNDKMPLQWHTNTNNICKLCDILFLRIHSNPELITIADDEAKFLNEIFEKVDNSDYPVEPELPWGDFQPAQHNINLDQMRVNVDARRDPIPLQNLAVIGDADGIYDA